MKKYILVLFLVVFIIPSVVFASWWNPFSWFAKNTKQPSMVQQINTTATSTADNLTPPATKNTSTQLQPPPKAKISQNKKITVKQKIDTNQLTVSSDSTPVSDADYQVALNDFLNAHPEYRAENDPNNTKWNLLKKYYQTSSGGIKNPSLQQFRDWLEQSNTQVKSVLASSSTASQTQTPQQANDCYEKMLKAEQPLFQAMGYSASQAESQLMAICSGTSNSNINQNYNYQSNQTQLQEIQQQETQLQQQQQKQQQELERQKNQLQEQKQQAYQQCEQAYQQKAEQYRSSVLTPQYSFPTDTCYQYSY